MPVPDHDDDAAEVPAEGFGELLGAKGTRAMGTDAELRERRAPFTPMGTCGHTSTATEVTDDNATSTLGSVLTEVSLVAKTKWGTTFEWVSGLASMVPALPLAVASGAISAVNGEGFDKGADKVFNAVGELIDRAGELGDEHADTLTDAAVGAGKAALLGAAGVVGKEAAQRAIGGNNHQG